MGDAPSKQQMMECLKKSGYLLEGRLVRCLNEMGLFVDPCQSIVDKQTGISREIDIVAENHRYTQSRKETCVKSYFVIEAVNNLYPVVLLTPRPWTPSAPVEYYLKYKATPAEETEIHPFLREINPFELWGVHDYQIFSQYCTFTPKKTGDLMAWHPDDLHASIKKVAEYSMHSMKVYHDWMDSKNDAYWRLFLWKPIIVLQNDLLTLRKNADGTEELIQSGIAKLEYNFHYCEEPETVVIDFVTEAALRAFVEQVISIDDHVEEMISQIKTRSTHNGENVARGD